MKCRAKQQKREDRPQRRITNGKKRREETERKVVIIKANQAARIGRLQQLRVWEDQDEKEGKETEGGELLFTFIGYTMLSSNGNTHTHTHITENEEEGASSESSVASFSFHYLFVENSLTRSSGFVIWRRRKQKKRNRWNKCEPWRGEFVLGTVPQQQQVGWFNFKTSNWIVRHRDPDREKSVSHCHFLHHHRHCYCPLPPPCWASVATCRASIVVAIPQDWRL